MSVRQVCPEKTKIYWNRQLTGRNRLAAADIHPVAPVAQLITIYVKFFTGKFFKSIFLIKGPIFLRIGNQHQQPASVELDIWPDTVV